MKMNPEVKAKWLEALRSGKYEQGIGKLRRTGDDGKARYCCLGVICDIHPPLGRWHEKEYGEHHKEEGFLFSDGSWWAGSLSGEAGVQVGLDYPALNTLIEMNDQQRASFSEIADFIDQNL